MNNLIEVLDHGFVEFLNSMGDDFTPAQDARISTGSEAKDIQSDINLTRFLLRHKHTTPFEGVILKFKVRAPILVIREWFRHRTFCLSGDTKLIFDTPSNIKKNKRKNYSYTIEEIYNKWNYGAKGIKNTKTKFQYESLIDPEKFYTNDELNKLCHYKSKNYIGIQAKKGIIKHNNPKIINQKFYCEIKGIDFINFLKNSKLIRIPMQDRIKKMFLRSCNEITGEIYHTHINNIFQSGIKEIYEVELENNYKIKCSKDHLFLTQNGWTTLEQSCHLKNNKNNISWSDLGFLFSVNGKRFNTPLYKIKDWLQIHKNLGFSKPELAILANVKETTINYYFKKYSLKYTKEELGLMTTRLITGKHWKISKSMSPEHRKKISENRKGIKSNWWKGGISKRNTTYKNKDIFLRDNYKCVFCENKHQSKLHVHHIDPFWHAPEKVNDNNNLITVCHFCHKLLHGNNLELKFLEIYEVGKLYPDFFEKNNVKMSCQHHKNVKKRNQYHYFREWSKIKSIKYIGKEMTYDISVDGPFQNFVADGFVVHNSYNEESGRYKQLDPLYYLPKLNRIAKQSTTNKQGSGDSFTLEEQQQYTSRWNIEQQTFEILYQDLNDDGMAKELARLNMPVSHYSTFIVTGNLLNWFRFLQLRMAPQAQFEIRQFANIVASLIQERFPICYSAFEDYWLNALTLTAPEIEALKIVEHYRNYCGQYASNATKNSKDNEWYIFNSTNEFGKKIQLKGRELQEFKDKLEKIYE